MATGHKAVISCNGDLIPKVSRPGKWFTYTHELVNKRVKLWVEQVSNKETVGYGVEIPVGFQKQCSIANFILGRSEWTSAVVNLWMAASFSHHRAVDERTAAFTAQWAMIWWDFCRDQCDWPSLFVWETSMRREFLDPYIFYGVAQCCRLLDIFAFVGDVPAVRGSLILSPPGWVDVCTTSTQVQKSGTRIHKPLIRLLGQYHLEIFCIHWGCSCSPW